MLKVGDYVWFDPWVENIWWPGRIVGSYMTIYQQTNYVIDMKISNIIYHRREYEINIMSEEERFMLKMEE